MRLRCMLQLLLSLEQQLRPKRIWGYPPDQRLQNVNPFVTRRNQYNEVRKSVLDLPIVLLLLRIRDERNVVSAELEHKPVLTSTEPFVVVVAMCRPT